MFFAGDIPAQFAYSRICAGDPASRRRWRAARIGVLARNDTGKELIKLDVVVTDNSGKSVPGLEPRDLLCSYCEGNSGGRNQHSKWLPKLRG